MPGQMVVDGDRDFLWRDARLHEVVHFQGRPDEAKEECDHSYRSITEHVLKGTATMK